MASLWSELKRRNVVRVGIAYVLVCWVILQIVDFALQVIDAPNWVLQVLVLLAVVGLPAVVIFSWVFEMTPEGLKLEKELDRSESITGQTGQKLNVIIIGVLVVAVALLSYRQFVAPPTGASPALETASSADVLRELPNSIAVLPFEDYSENQDQGHFSKGIAEEVLNLLAKTDSLRVAARTSSFAFGGSEVDIRDIGEKLDVGTVLEGSIRKAGDTIRITAQLIKVEDGYHIWSETYDRDYVDIFKIQDDIAAAIMDSLRVHLLGEEEQLMHSEVATNVDAYSAFLIGKERMALRTKEDLAAAREQFEKAIALDPTYAPARVQLAHAWLLSEQFWFGGDDIEQDDVDAIIVPHLEKALELSPDSAEAIAVQGYHHLRRYRYAEAKANFDQALALNPNDAQTYGWRAEIAHEEGRFLDMLADKEKAYALDPMSLQIASDLASVYRNFWRPEDADRIIQRMFDLHPDHPVAYMAAISNLMNHGRRGEGVLMLERAIAANPDNENFQRFIGWGFMYLGMTEEAAERGDDQVRFAIALTDGDFEEAARLLDQGMQGEDAEDWYQFGRWLYSWDQGEGARAKLNQYVQLDLARMEGNNEPWQERCYPYMISELRKIGQGERTEPMMAACKRDIEERFKAKYLCPCSWQYVVFYSILAGREDEAIERADMWLSHGDSDFGLHVDALFRELEHRPEYADLLARNARQIERQREIYKAGINRLSTGSLN